MNLKVCLELLRNNQSKLRNLNSFNLKQLLVLLFLVLPNLFLDNNLLYLVLFSNNLFLQESSQNLYLAQISKKEAFFQLINTQQVYLPHNLMNFKIIFKKVVGYFQEIFNKEVGYFKISPKIHKVCYSQIKVKIFFKEMNKNQKRMMKMKVIKMKMNILQFCWIMSHKQMIHLKSQQLSKLKNLNICSQKKKSRKSAVMERFQ